MTPSGITQGSGYRSDHTVLVDELKKAGVSVTHRITFGEDIDAACGQLANKVEKAKVF